MGIYIPKPDNMLQDELEAIEWIFQACGLKKEQVCTEYMIKKLREKTSNDDKFYKFLDRYQFISYKENQIKYRDEYLKQALGGLSSVDIEDQANMFLQEKVKLF